MRLSAEGNIGRYVAPMVHMQQLEKLLACANCHVITYITFSSFDVACSAPTGLDSHSFSSLFDSSLVSHLNV